MFMMPCEIDSDSGNIFVHKLNRNCVAPAIRISRQQAEIYEDRYVANYASRGCEATCRCVFSPLIIKRSGRYAPAAARALPRAPSIALKSIGAPWLASQTPKWRGNFSGDARESTKWWISRRRRAQRRRRSFAAALKNASSALATSPRSPPISSFAACLVGQSVQLTHRQ